MNQIYVGEIRCHGTYDGVIILILCYLEPLQITARLWHDWDIFDKVAQHHSAGFTVPSEALETSKFTLFVQEPDLQQLPV